MSWKGITDRGTFAVFKNSQARADTWYQACKARGQACVHVALGSQYASVEWDYFSMRNGDHVAAGALDEIVKLFRAHAGRGAKFSGGAGVGLMRKLLPDHAELVAREVAEVLHKYRVNA